MRVGVMEGIYESQHAGSLPEWSSWKSRIWGRRIVSQMETLDVSLNVALQINHGKTPIVPTSTGTY